MSKSTRLSTFNPLPLDSQDRLMLKDRDNRYSRSLTFSEQPNWTHAYIYCRHVMENLQYHTKYYKIYSASEVIKSKMSDSRTMQEFQFIYTPEYMYLFICDRSSYKLKGRAGADTRIMIPADEVVEFENFRDLETIHYIKCRSEDVRAQDKHIHKEKFIRDFMERTELQ